jgi:lysozyme
VGMLAKFRRMRFREHLLTCSPCLVRFRALNATLRYCPVLATEPETRLAAIVDFAFNLGAGRLQTSTLRRRINQRDWSGTTAELGKWVYGGGRVLPGLVTRRQAEAVLLA